MKQDNETEDRPKPSWFVWLLAFCLIAVTAVVVFGGIR